MKRLRSLFLSISVVLLLQEVPAHSYHTEGGAVLTGNELTFSPEEVGTYVANRYPELDRDLKGLADNLDSDGDGSFDHNDWGGAVPDEPTAPIDTWVESIRWFGPVLIQDGDNHFLENSVLASVVNGSRGRQGISELNQKMKDLHHGL